MDVRCPRCGTEYEFDDALVSDRGTTVKCTNCAHQFKIRPAGGSAPERWVVRTGSGRELVYTSLRDLQRGIAQRQVGPDDLLSRGNQPPRPLGSIAELEPFFASRSVAPQRAAPRTLAGVAPPANVIMNSPVPGSPRVATVPPPKPATLPPPRTAVVGPLPPITPPPPTAAPMPRFERDGPPPVSGIDVEAPTRPYNPRPEGDALGDTLMAPTGRGAERSFFEPEVVRAPPRVESRPPPRVEPRPAPRVEPSAPREPRIVAPVLTPTPAEVRASYDSLRVRDSISDTSVPPGQRRRASSRFIVGLVLTLGVALLGVTVGRKYLQRFGPPAPSAAPSADPRVASLVDEGQRAFDDGDLELAKEKLDKASALSDTDVAVLAATARLEIARADLLWIELRVLDPKEKTKVESVYRQLGRRVGKAQQAVDAAVAASGTDPVVQRAHVDALRLAGELAKARSLVGPLAQNASVPENAYSLAVLDMADATPVWSSVVDRLRTAAAAERGLGRARAALVYALARAGDLPGAELELGKLESLTKQVSLVTELSAFVKRMASAPKEAGADAAVIATIDPSSLPKLDTTRRSDEEEPPAAEGDFRGQLSQAASALASGELDRAERLFNAVLGQQPGNTEAIAGLADIARQRKDPSKAEELYDKVLRDNPTYLPALIGRADQKWDAGDRAGAIALYRKVLEHAGPGTSYGQRAAARIAQGAGDKSASDKPASDKPATDKPASDKPASDKPVSDTPATDKPASDKPASDKPPEIDTSDLPGFGK